MDDKELILFAEDLGLMTKLLSGINSQLTGRLVTTGRKLVAELRKQCNVDALIAENRDRADMLVAIAAMFECECKESHELEDLLWIVCWERDFAWAVAQRAINELNELIELGPYEGGKDGSTD